MKGRNAGQLSAEPDRCRVFVAELARLLVLQGLDVDTLVRRSSVRVVARLQTDDGRRAGVCHEWSREQVEDIRLAPMSFAIHEADRIRAMMPEPS